LAPLIYSILPTRWTSSHTLRQVRSQLTRDLNDIINELGPTLFPDFGSFFLRDTEIPPTAQSAAGLQRVSSWVSSWLAVQGYPAGSKSGLSLALDLHSPVTPVEKVNEATPPERSSRVTFHHPSSSNEDDDEGEDEDEDEDEGIIVVRATGGTTETKKQVRHRTGAVVAAAANRE
jgi:glycerol-3-phosphate O-acyltransferase/dihydroxyacetone phosphate acyltransferase